MTIELELRKTLLKTGKQPIVIRIQRGKDLTRKNTGFSVFEKDWDNFKRQVKRTHPNYSEINTALVAKVNKAEKAYAVLSKSTEHVSSKAVVGSAFTSHSFMSFIQKEYDALKNKPEKSSTAKKYNTMMVLLRDYDPDVVIEAIDGDWLEGFRDKRKAAGIKHNTIVSNLSVYRTLYKYAIKELRFKPEVNPFEEIKIGDFRSANREPLEAEDIEKLHNFLGLPSQNRVRDIWLTSYYLAGIRFGDVLRLKWTDIKDGRITIQPNKTENSSGMILDLKIHRRLAEIFKKYDRSTETIFNVVKTGYPEEIDRINRSMSPTLKTVLLGAGIAKNVGFANARNTFAKAARKKDSKDMNTTKDALGHTKIKTTEIYTGMDTEAIDDLMNKVYGE